MRAAVLETSLVLGLGLGGLGPGACARPGADRGEAGDRARDARPRAGVTQDDVRAPQRDTPTPARPDSVPGPGLGVTSALATAPAPAPRPALNAESAGDTPPQMHGRAPFRYPGALYRGRVEGNVTLHLWVDATGRVRPESTRVAESSGARLLDSAAVAGSARLVFTPARHDGRATGAALLFPVHFRHPAVRHR